MILAESSQHIYVLPSRLLVVIRLPFMRICSRIMLLAAAISQPQITNSAANVAPRERTR